MDEVEALERCHVETVRPRREVTVVDPADGLFVVAARFTAADGTIFNGYVTPSASGNDAESPTILTESGDAVPFWYGIRKPSSEAVDRAYQLLDKASSELFPIRVETLLPTTAGAITAEVEGFGYFDKRLNRLFTS